MGVDPLNPNPNISDLAFNDKIIQNQNQLAANKILHNESADNLM